MKNKLLLVVSLCLFCIGFYSCTSENEVSLSEKEISTYIVFTTNYSSIFYKQ